jgi:hypothetical protein
LLRTLGDAPIEQGGNRISATTDYVRADGGHGQAYDVELAYDVFSTEIADVQMGEQVAPGDVGNVDRGASSPKRSPTPARVAPVKPATDPMEQAASPSWRRAIEAARRAPAWDRRTRERGPELERPGAEQEEWMPGAPAAGGALHNSLSSIARRRLQMIDAMAGFNGGEGAAELALRPQRHVDSRTLELLTTMPRTASMG